MFMFQPEEWDNPPCPGRQDWYVIRAAQKTHSRDGGKASHYQLCDPAQQSQAFGRLHGQRWAAQSSVATHESRIYAEGMPTDRFEFGDSMEPGADAELCSLGAEFQENHRQQIELVENNQRLAGEPPLEALEAIQSCMQAKQKLAEAIAQLRAMTISGLRVKAAVLLAYSQYDLDGKLHWTDHDELMGWSIARDLLSDETDSDIGVGTNADVAQTEAGSGVKPGSANT